MTFDPDEPLPLFMGRPHYYRLDEARRTVPIKTRGEQMDWYKGQNTEEGFDAKKRVAKSIIDEDCNVSTVFLHIDHAYTSDSPPILFETMVFGGRYDQYQERYSTWEEAEAGHQRVVEAVLDGTLEDSV